uniref:Uncharacterized protein n=1 Tax=Heterorhabditis bacteriophora TaxID=37862 RepID=A0A1I7XLK7_HETBA
MSVMKSRRGVFPPRVINIDERSAPGSSTKIDLKPKRRKGDPREAIENPDEKPRVPHEPIVSPEILIDSKVSLI